MGGVKSPVLFCQGRVWPSPLLSTSLYASIFILSLPFWYLVLLRQAEAGKWCLECCAAPPVGL